MAAITLPTAEPITNPQPVTAPRTVRPRSTNLPLGYLRAFIIVMVVLHHAVLPYYVKAPHIVHSMVPAPRWWQNFPVVDSTRWSGFTPFVLFNDAYTMAVLFLISGFFSWSSLSRRHPLGFLRNRFIRLGIPYVAMSLLTPLAYYTVYLAGGMHDGFWHEWFALHVWPPGPAWFLFSLFLLDMVAVVVYSLLRSQLALAGHWLTRIQSPAAIVLLVTVLSSIGYIPAMMHYGLYNMGNSMFPVARMLQYLSFFLVGLALGSAGIEAGMLGSRSRLPARWLPLIIAAAAAFVSWQCLGYYAHRHYNPAFWGIVLGVSFCFLSATSVFAALAVALRFVKQPNPAWNSLLACSLGIYTIHFPLVSWLGFALLHVPAPGWIKAPIVFAITLPTCWFLVAQARRFRFVAEAF